MKNRFFVCTGVDSEDIETTFKRGKSLTENHVSAKVFFVSQENNKKTPVSEVKKEKTKTFFNFACLSPKKLYKKASKRNLVRRVIKNILIDLLKQKESELINFIKKSEQYESVVVCLFPQKDILILENEELKTEINKILVKLLTIK